MVSYRDELGSVVRVVRRRRRGVFRRDWALLGLALLLIAAIAVL